MNLSPLLDGLLAQLDQSGTNPSPTDAKQILAQLSALLASLPADGSLASKLKKPGAWRDVPLPPNRADTPLYVELPASIDFLNVPSDAVSGQLIPLSDGQGNAKITVRPLLGAHSGVDALTDNALADEITNLKTTVGALGSSSPIPSNQWSTLPQTLRRLAVEIKRIESVNARLSGTGTFADPSVIRNGDPIYVIAPITLGFPGVSSQKIRFQISQGIVRAST